MLNTRPTTKKLFFNEQGEKLSFKKAKNSGISIGVPGIVSLLNIAHKDHGKLAWKDLFAPALRHSKDGFSVSPRMHKSIVSYEKNFY